MCNVLRRCFVVLLLVPFTFHACSRWGNQDNIRVVIPVVEYAFIDINGDLSDWKRLPHVFETLDFQSPWSAKPFGRMVFRAIADSAWLYFSFEVNDSTLVSVPFTEELDVSLGDRVEIFLSGDVALTDYYCLEVGPYGDVLDYQASYYRQFDDTWNLTDLTVCALPVANGYTVEGRIPLAFLRQLNNQIVGSPLTFWMGLYRAEYRERHTAPNPVQWITWVSPLTAEADFHVPSSFRKVYIE